MRRAAIAVVFGLIASLAISCSANDAKPFDTKAFAEAQAAGGTILVHVTAPWCPTCRRQHPIIDSIKQERPTLLVYEVDFDSEKEALKRFGVQYQSTLILFKGAQEIGRSTGETDPGRIRALVAQGF